VIKSLANIFKVNDLRNKILFVVAMVAVYRLGVFIRVPGVDSIAISQLKDTANQQGALGFPPQKDASRHSTGLRRRAIPPGAEVEEVGA